MNFVKQIIINQDECWYGPVAVAGVNMPFDINTKDYNVNMQPNDTGNQGNPLLLSNKGRIIWGEDGFKLNINEGVMTFTSKKREPEIFEGFHNLKGAYKEASKRFFPTNGQVPPKEFFVKPQYNSWIELLYDQTQENILKYAHSIADNGMPRGILMIDDGWNTSYGDLTFDEKKFSDPKGMIKELHEMGFQIMMWICPFISPDTVNARHLMSEECLIKETQNKIKIIQWWNGYSACLDLSNPKASQWLKEQCDNLVNNYGVDGFKFDAGDGHFYNDEDITYCNVDANTQAMFWNMFGLNYPLNEYRACYKCAGLPLVQRLNDKNHKWDKNGVSSLVPNALAQGILGYSYCCPDMIGGGDAGDFLNDSMVFEPDLMVRSCAASALMPMMQYSVAPWRILPKEMYKMCQNFSALHVQFSEDIYKLALNAASTGEPIIRYMEYEYPNSGYEKITNQFMLGSNIIVVPVVTKDATAQKVILPKGQWRGFDGNIYNGEQVFDVLVKLSDLPYFVKLAL